MSTVATNTDMNLLYLTFKPSIIYLPYPGALTLLPNIILYACANIGGKDSVVPHLYLSAQVSVFFNMVIVLLREKYVFQQSDHEFTVYLYSGSILFSVIRQE